MPGLDDMSDEIKKTNIKLYCRVGDTVEITKKIETNPAPNKGNPEQIEKGTIYQVADLIGLGWDLELVKGSGPKLIRIMNSSMPSLAKIIKHQPSTSGDISSR